MKLDHSEHTARQLARVPRRDERKHCQQPLQPRIAGDDKLMLGTRQVVAALTSRNPSIVLRHCQPIASDVATRIPLYDCVAAQNVLSGLRRNHHDRSGFGPYMRL